MKVEGDSLIFVEAMVKTEGKLIGRIVDSKNQPVVYANIALLNVGDTAIVNSGVSNENGDFVIPTTEERLRVRISCVGYETLVLNCETGNLGTIILNETTECTAEPTLLCTRPTNRRAVLAPRRTAPPSSFPSKLVYP